MKTISITTFTIMGISALLFGGVLFSAWHQELIPCLIFMAAWKIVYLCGKYYLEPHIKEIKREIELRKSFQQSTIILKILLLWE